MSSDVLSPQIFPYAVAAGVLFGLVLIEIAAMAFGAGPLAGLGHVFGAHSHGGAATTGHAAASPGARPGFSVLGWLNGGRAPFAVVVLSLLAGFALTGGAIVTVCNRFGATCAPWMSMPLALVAAAVVTRHVTRIVGRLMPKDETYAIGADGLLGHLGVVTVGPVCTGRRGRCKTRDRFGNWHFPLIEVADDAARFQPGETVMLVAYRSGAFRVAAPDPRLLTEPSAGPVSA